MNLFDAAEADRRKETGMAKAASARPELLGVAQAVALGLAADGREVSMDDVAAEMAAQGYDFTLLGNAAGSVFKGPGWTCSGFTRSVRASTHGRAIRLWKLKGTCDE